MQTLTKFVATAVVSTTLAVPAAITMTPSAAVAAECSSLPGGSYTYNAKTLDSSPARVGPYESCAIKKTFAAGATVGLSCWLTNSIGNVWYKVYSPSNTWIYSGHFAASVKSHVASCNS